ncbi:MAG: class I SAM-dependent methyltransferase [Dehalococcoidia bacterium]
MTVSNNAAVIRRWSAYTSKHFTDQGDFAREHLLNPVIFAMLGDVAGRRVLDAGCGQGYLARLLAARGALVTGVEPSEAMYRYTVEREQRERRGITFVQADLSTYSVSTGVFDAVVANMVLMDIPDFEAAIGACIRALRPGGDFIFSLSHPCFEEDGAAWAKGYVAVAEYLNEHTIEQAVSMRFHRPLSRYLNAVIDGGCRLRKLVEPRLGDEWAEGDPAQARNAHVPSFIVVHASKD